MLASKQILQKKAFLSTYRLTISNKDKMRLIMELKKLHEAVFEIQMKMSEHERRPTQ
jgi:hypothetical protein